MIIGQSHYHLATQVTNVLKFVYSYSVPKIVQLCFRHFSNFTCDELSNSIF